MNVLTFDLEDWFHLLDHAATRTEREWSCFPSRVEPNTHRILDLLDTRGQRATFFCLGWIARKYSRLVREIAERGHDIGCHSNMHQLVYEIGPKHFALDLDTAIASVESASGRRVISYRAPGFSVTHECPWFFDTLLDRGIQIDCSVFRTRRAHGGLRSFGHAEPEWVRTATGRIKEFPMNSVKLIGKEVVFSGGGYFRLFPVTLVRRWMKRSPYVMTYFHPRDFDPDQPIVPGLSWARRFRSYYGLRGALAKLDTLLQEFNFVDLETAASTVDWVKAPEVTVFAPQFA